MVVDHHAEAYRHAYYVVLGDGNDDGDNNGNNGLP